ncbi:hypothetical protein QMA0440_01241 [Yersinia ruckeri]|nr:hypothetical protein QMA0440_01241 [Yersinia ruckeri]AUQ42711.1 hypothetical protein NJ56_12835 [Yersinia ruckeri]KFE39684.1 Type IIA topoisomerase (DNA gyrase/topo II, topoisomerase IV), B subunit [Yersinia ruckeri]OJC10467.1 hypothetical protein AXW56_06315 [Yersinia ruckeri]OJC60244.1 hypothetical protein AXW36_06320 [Yersinia ruckeri]
MKMKMKINMIKYKKQVALLFLAVSLLITFFTWDYIATNQGFECHGQMKRKLFVNSTCNKNSIFDVFFSMQNNGEGYLLVSGTYSCHDSEQTSVDGMIRFKHKKEGSYHSIDFDNKNKELSEIFDVLNYDNIKIKITELSNNDYIISTPIETIMVCSKE